jgi:ABC-type polysaccharide/polyol phosphate export permease
MPMYAGAVARIESEIARPTWRGRRLNGVPAALRSTVDLLLALSQSDLRVRYGRGPGRVLRWLFEPFALVGIYLILDAFVIRRGGGAAGLSIAAAVVPFQLVMLSVTNVMNSLEARRPIVLNMAFRRTLIPLSAVCTEAVSFAASFFLIGCMMAAYLVAPTGVLLWLVILIPVNLFVAAGFAYGMALFAIWFRELWAFGLSFIRMLFFVGPGLVPLSATQGTANKLLRLNPLTGLFEGYRDVFYYGRTPAAWEFLYPFCFAVVLLAIFVPIYRREQRQFAKIL